ncbi:hypothetical protein SAM23877_1264 [Streptomyces ambofaciens ATCC 23877]|uniref:Uncharacterized protein n=1 Tax=Streptomyces ambofaciens (strain ATCC 23877 / 3486 / DSM 40053 / JCM 4204 / NBRC 12836 / NRRL B-2516) TaxID=278992 RepID=A0A0K2AMT7_STRA7|nr:hypothetical protein SAM23877_1264 [Streptomyces ambofaciens ATCC 23877]
MAGSTLRTPLTTRDTVARETPACLATSSSVGGRLIMRTPYRRVPRPDRRWADRLRWDVTARNRSPRRRCAAAGFRPTGTHAPRTPRCGAQAVVGRAMLGVTPVGDPGGGRRWGTPVGDREGNLRGEGRRSWIASGLTLDLVKGSGSRMWRTRCAASGKRPATADWA